MPRTEAERLIHYRKLNKDRYDRVRKLALYSLGNKCGLCGEDDPKVLEIHHPNKDRQLHRKYCYKTRKYRNYNISPMKYWEGIALQATPFKVELLCANCHRKVEE